MRQTVVDEPAVRTWRTATLIGLVARSSAITMRDRRPVAYPPRRGHPLADAVTLTIGLVIVLVAGGMAVVALAALFSITPTATDPRYGDVDAARAQIEAADAPSVRAVVVEPNVFGRRTQFVALVRGAEEADARTAWCEVILPTGIGRVLVQLNGSGGQWRAPGDCSDPTSRPEFRAPSDD